MSRLGCDHDDRELDSALICNACNAEKQIAGDALAAALKSWVDVMEEMRSDPADPVTAIREKYHGKRLAQSRAALEAWQKADG